MRQWLPAHFLIRGTGSIGGPLEPDFDVGQVDTCLRDEIVDDGVAVSRRRERVWSAEILRHIGESSLTVSIEFPAFAAAAHQEPGMQAVIVDQSVERLCVTGK